MQRRRELMAMQTDGLPSAYQKVEYIENSGTQYINSNHVPTIAPRIEAKLMITNSADTDRFGFALNQFPSFIVDAAAFDWYNRWGATSFTRITMGVSLLNREITCTFGQNTNINNEKTGTFSDTDWSSNTQQIQVFAGRNISRGMRLYYCKIYDGNALVRNLIPCVRKSDSKPGMYDTVSKTFYTNTGTGEFIVPA